MNAMVSNENRGRILTLYVLILGLFYGLGQLLATDIDPAGHAMLMLTAAFYGLALVPVTAIWVGEPQLHVPVGVKLFRTFRISPIGALACLMTGLISSTFAAIGPLYGLELRFSQQTIVLLMAATQLGALFLQFPLGYLSDRVDRRAMMLWLAIALALICTTFLFAGPTTPFWVFLILFSIFGGISEIFYPLGVAHANDRADSGEFVTLSSNLLLIWALGGTIGPVIVTVGVTPFGTTIFFWYAIALAVLFAAYALWRRHRQPPAGSREQFVAYPQTSPMVYEWTPHDEADGGDAGKGHAMTRVIDTFPPPDPHDRTSLHSDEGRRAARGNDLAARGRRRPTGAGHSRTDPLPPPGWHGVPGHEDAPLCRRARLRLLPGGHKGIGRFRRPAD